MTSTRSPFEYTVQSCLVAVFLLVMFGSVPRIKAQPASAEKPEVSDQPLTDEQLSVYRIVFEPLDGERE